MESSNMQQIKKKKPDNRLKVMMKVAENPYSTGVNFHIYKRKRIPSVIEMGAVTDQGWADFRQDLQTEINWNAGNELIISHKMGLPEARCMNIIHLDIGTTVYRNFDGWIVLVYDHDSDNSLLNKLKLSIQHACSNNSVHKIGFLQNTGMRQFISFSKYKPYDHDLIPYMGEQAVQFRDRMLHHLNEENGNGLYLLHGHPGTGKTSFIKSVLSLTKRKAIYMSAAMADKLTSPEMIGLLMDYPDSVLVMEDAETTLMKRAADNSSAVSNLLNMSDGFPADFLNLCIICTFNTELDNIDPALLRKGRLKGMFEFKPLQPSQVKELAEFLYIEVDAKKPMSLAEVCNGGVGRNYFEGKEIGFVNSV
jgi:hypothetical protein